MQNLRLCSWIYCIHALQLQRKVTCMGSCLGGYVRPPRAAVPDKGSRPPPAFQRRDWRRSSSNAMGDNDDHHGPSQAFNSEAFRRFSRSLNDRHHSVGSASYVHDAPSFENHALSSWHKQRQEWVGSRQKPQPRVMREPVIRWSATYEELLGTSRPFAEPVPLPEMVDFLVDVWEQEGLYG